jgi:hypothetical protein
VPAKANTSPATRTFATRPCLMDDPSVSPLRLHARRHRSDPAYPTCVSHLVESNRKPAMRPLIAGVCGDTGGPGRPSFPGIGQCALGAARTRQAARDTHPIRARRALLGEQRGIGLLLHDRTVRESGRDDVSHARRRCCAVPMCPGRPVSSWPGLGRWRRSSGRPASTRWKATGSP